VRSDTPPPRGRGPVLARFAEPTAPSTTFAVVADPHVTPLAEGTWKLYHRTEQRLRTAVADCERLALDALVVAGDLTKDGDPAEFDRFDDIVGDLDAPVVAVPGNHDVPKVWDDHATPPVSEFVARYTPGRLPFVTRVGGVDLVGLNTATVPGGDLSSTHAGRVSRDQLAWLETVLPDLETPVVCLHHGTTRPRSVVPKSDPDHHLRNASAVADRLSPPGAELVVSGHLHWPAVGRPAGVPEVVAPPVCSFPQAGLLVHIEPRGTTVSLLPLADRNGLREAHRAVRHRADRLSMPADDALSYFDRFPLVDERRHNPLVSDHADIDA